MIKSPIESPALSSIWKRSLFLRKRPILLLEVMIAIALIAMVAIPLIYPHIYLIRAQAHFLEKVELDNSVNLHFVDLMEKLYINDIPWEGVAGGQEYSFPDDLLVGMGYIGSYRFKVRLYKPRGQSESPLTLYLLDLDYSFYPKGQAPHTDNLLKYHYNLFVVRDLGSHGLPEGDREEGNIEEDEEVVQ